MEQEQKTKIENEYRELAMKLAIEAARKSLEPAIALLEKSIKEGKDVAADSQDND